MDLIKTVLMAMVVTAALASTACNTMEGAGKDVERAGEEIQDASDG